MTVTLIARSPSEFVEYLISPGLPTSLGPVPLNAYVSGRTSPAARRAFQLFNGLVETRRARERSDRDYSAAVSALRRTRGDVVSSGRTSSWRRVFTGQGVPEHIVAVWNAILAHRELLVTLPAHGLHEGAVRPFAHYFGSGGNPIAGMVGDGIFGYDCLGFVGNYLAWAGARSGYPEVTVAQYIDSLGFEVVESLADAAPLWLLIWPPGDSNGQHIAIIDRVHSCSADAAVVDLCQSSTGGPQCNQRAELRLYEGGRISFDGAPRRAFNIRAAGTPAAPVVRAAVLARHPGLRLTRAG